MEKKVGMTVKLQMTGRNFVQFFSIFNPLLYKNCFRELVKQIRNHLNLITIFK